MNILLIFILVYAGFIAMSFWESSVEGRNAWDKGKYGWKIKIGKYVILTKYHFFLTYVMLPSFLALPLVTYGWDIRLFGVLLSAASSGIVIEDFFWYVLNPKVKFKEFFSSFSDYYPWIKINGRKIIPRFYILSILIAFLSWYFLWRYIIRFKYHFL